MSKEERSAKGEAVTQVNATEEPAAAERVTAEDAGEALSAEQAATLRIAEALGVSQDEAGEAALGGDGAQQGQGAPDGEESAPRNRAERRRDEALERQRVASGQSPEQAAQPKDRNARARELLQRRQSEAASGVSGSRAAGRLDAGELVDDVFSRSLAGAGRWFKANARGLQWAALGLAVAGGLFLGWSNLREKKAMAATRLLGEGIGAQQGRVLAEDKRSAEEKELDPTKVFKTGAERTQAALASLDKLVSEHGGTGPALLGQLARAGAQLEAREWDKAIEGFSAVVASPLATADVDVRGRALEGLGFAREGKKDLDGALATFKELEGVDAKGLDFKEIAQYHQARVLLAKGDKEKARDLLKGLHDKLELPRPDSAPSTFLRPLVDELLRQIDPALAPPRPSMGNLGGAMGGAMSPEQMEALLRKAKAAAEKRGEADGH